MSDFSQNQWKQFEQIFGAKFPAPPQASLTDLSWIEPYVQQTLKQVLSRSLADAKSGPASSASAPLRFETFETVGNVIVKIDIPDKARARNTAVYAGVNAVRLVEGAGVRKETIPLPVAVVPESCKAVYKQGILQLQLKKRKTDEHFHEVRVRYLN